MRIKELEKFKKRKEKSENLMKMDVYSGGGEGFTQKMQSPI